MASTEVRMPQASMGDTEGVVNEWLKSPGDTVQEGEVLAMVELAKAMVEVVAPVSGVLSEVKVPADGDVTAGDVIAIITTAD